MLVQIMEILVQLVQFLLAVVAEQQVQLKNLADLQQVVVEQVVAIQTELQVNLEVQELLTLVAVVVVDLVDFLTQILQEQVEQVDQE
tara:strand:+ start:377 stop:637 length:261 start_codon:yes stop_codon:yes gene_type:complete